MCLVCFLTFITTKTNGFYPIKNWNTKINYTHYTFCSHFFSIFLPFFLPNLEKFCFYRPGEKTHRSHQNLSLSLSILNQTTTNNIFSLLFSVLSIITPTKGNLKDQMLPFSLYLRKVWYHSHRKYKRL